MDFITFSVIKEEFVSKFSRKLVKTLKKRPFDIAFFMMMMNSSHLASSMCSLSPRQYEDKIRTHFLAFKTLAL